MSDKAPPAPGPSPAESPSPIGTRPTWPVAAPRRTSLTLDEVGPLWEAFRGGAPVSCICGNGTLALSVDGSNAYRLVCTRCGTASPWFEAAPAGIRLRTLPPPADDGPDDD